MGDINPLANQEEEQEEGQEEEVQKDLLHGLAVLYSEEGGWSIQPLDGASNLSRADIMAFCWDFMGNMLISNFAVMESEAGKDANAEG